MFVKDIMTLNPITVEPDQTISEVLDLMNEHQLHRVPVVTGNKLVGLITQGVVQANSPSHLSTLSIHEMNYLLSKTKVKDIMIKQVFTTSPGALIEEAASVLEEKDIGCLPVINEQHELQGIITTRDMMKALVDFFGYRRSGTRIGIKVEDRVGILSDLTGLLAKNNISIIQLINRGAEIVVVCDSTDEKRLLELLDDPKYHVFSIIKR